MKTIKYTVGAMLLMVLSQSVWSFTTGFASSNPTTIMHFIQGNSALIYLSTFFGLGILLAFTPCVLPMVPILSGIIIGQRSLSSRKAFKLSLSYVIGMAVTYAAAGMLAGYLGSTVQTLMQQPAVIITFSLLFVLMALSMFGLFELRLPASVSQRLTNIHQTGGRKSYLSVALMGVISTLVVSPCVTAPLIGVLTYIGQSGQPFMGGLILFVMATGMGLPLLMVGAGYGSILPKTGSWMLVIRKLFGIIMLAMAIWISSRILPPAITHLLWAGLFILGSLAMGSLGVATGKWGKLLKGIGISVLVAGSIILYNTSLMLFKPSQAVRVEEVKPPFINLHSMPEIEKQLSLAKQQHKAVFMEFFASWCSDCQAMETRVFNQPEVARAMDGLINLKIDISENSEQANDIKRAFAIYGTPTMLFLDKEGQPLNQLTAVGFINKTSLLKLLRQVHFAP
ncbi:protein-disulfide reductase DsbD [Legionella spiritensis]|uniref:protein-disulfide reductase DsbD n=1 Tax=Legionella spiritensis TaxID=452 RepID=UPI000F6F3799|nr:protein-disulfide reductase DsbD [Legionella spiritensis]VEG90679.1 thiol:disulfide interchange protein DsbD [Legionella spiritensis]